MQSDWVEECLAHYLEFALPRTQLSSFYFQSRIEKLEVFFLFEGTGHICPYIYAKECPLRPNQVVVQDVTVGQDVVLTNGTQ